MNKIMYEETTANIILNGKTRELFLYDQGKATMFILATSSTWCSSPSRTVSPENASNWNQSKKVKLDSQKT